MFVVIEGIDRVGKTTLCEKLANELGLCIFKDDICESLNGMDADVKSVAALNAMKSIANVCSSANVSLVLDRFHATEAVYSCVSRGLNKYKAVSRFLETEVRLESQFCEQYLYIFVKPTDIKFSEEKHGSSLEKHEEFFEYLYSIIPNRSKIEVNFYTLDEAVKKVKERI